MCVHQAHPDYISVCKKKKHPQDCSGTQVNIFSVFENSRAHWTL